MYLYQYALMAALCCLLFKQDTRLAAITFLTGWLIYCILTIDASGLYYYTLSASIETAIGFILNRRYRLVSYLSYSLILVNIFGFYLYTNKVSPESYDIIYAIISTLQILVLITRGMINGTYKLSEYNPLVRVIDFDSRHSRVRMYKNPQAKKTNR